MGGYQYRKRREGPINYLIGQYVYDPIYDQHIGPNYLTIPKAFATFREARPRNVVLQNRMMDNILQIEFHKLFEKDD
jgi:hypothetical protein